MADRALSTSRRALLGAAAAIPFLPLQTAVGAEPVEAPPRPPSPDLAEWNDRLSRYDHLAVRAKAAAETGWFRAANDRYYREVADPTADHEAAFTRLERADDLYWRRCTEPMEEAASTLLGTPATSLAAVGIKLALLRTQQLHEREDWGTVLTVLEEDVRRLVEPSGHSLLTVSQSQAMLRSGRLA